MGVALAHRGSGRLVVGLQPDGVLMYGTSSLWVAAHHKIPMLVVMCNNRSYYGAWEYQETVAGVRGRPPESMNAALELKDPAPDFAGLARALGWYAEGPVFEGDALREALERAVKVIEEEGRPALVDAVTRYR